MLSCFGDMEYFVFQAFTSNIYFVSHSNTMKYKRIYNVNKMDISDRLNTLLGMLKLKN